MGGFSRRVSRQSEDEGRAAAGGVFDPKATVVCLHDPAADRQAQAQVTVLLAIEGLHDPLPLLRRDG